MKKLLWKVNSDILTNEEKLEMLEADLIELDEDTYPFNRYFYIQEEWNTYMTLRVTLVNKIRKLKALMGI